ncbi:MAG: glycosyl hydrolase family 18 protein [Treponema sp.]|nr:glycosyl hydrolase family 18 protein [Treponema sp.]
MKKTFAMLPAIIALAIIAGGCPAGGEDPDFIAGTSKVASYIRTWAIPEQARQGNSPYWNAGMIKGEYLSDLIIAFAIINVADGYSLYIPDVQSGFNVWKEVAALKAKYPWLAVKFSIGGGSADGLAGFSPMAADPDLRSKFVANVCAWLENYNLDGVDIDWEYPVGADWSDYHIPADKVNYITLLGDLRSAIDALGGKTGKYYQLSTAIPASTWFIEKNDVKAAAAIVDAMKLMTYDYYGSWSSTTGHNTNVYLNPGDPQKWSTDQAVQAYLAAGVPPEKINIGVPFYGQVWKGVNKGGDNSAPGLFQPAPSFVNTYSWDDIEAQYLQSGSGYTRYWDNTAKAPWLYNGNIWVSYTDPEQLKAITDYVKANDLGGVFVWEYMQDKNVELLRSLAVYLK